MITTSFANSPKEHAGIIAELLDDLLYNHIIIGDIHAPMNRISDIYKIVNNDRIIGGWSVFHGFDLPTVVLPPTIPEAWESIHSMINFLGIKEFYAPFPAEINNQNIIPPWTDWKDFSSELQFTDVAMQLAKKEIEVMDISNLPEIRGAKHEDADRIQEYFDSVEHQGFFNKHQLDTDIFVIAEDNDEIIAVGGAHFETPLTVQIGNIHVKKEYRKIGLGRAITTACILGVLRTKRLPTLFVNENNDIAIDLYKSFGFEEYNRYKFYKLTAG